MPSGKPLTPATFEVDVGKTIEVINTDGRRKVTSESDLRMQETGCDNGNRYGNTLTGEWSMRWVNVNMQFLGRTGSNRRQHRNGSKGRRGSFGNCRSTKDYTKQIKSDIADLKNTGGRKGRNDYGRGLFEGFAE